jgi:hypothetical protein
MIQRGRKGAARLAVISNMPGQRPVAPKSLTKEQVKVWRAVVATKPADWFTADSHPLLIGYCRAVVMADQLSAEVEAVAALMRFPDDMADAEEIKAYTGLFAMRKELLKQRSAEVDKITSLARSMRLTQQSRLKAETADTGHRRSNGAGAASLKPWQTA